MKRDQFLFMAEAEGKDNLVNTKTARINAAINEFVILHHHGYNINEHIADVLHKHGLTEALLTDAECRYIIKEVERRCN